VRFPAYFCVSGITALAAMSHRPPCRTIVFMYWPLVGASGGGLPPTTR
jgi:hypothetical protein